MDSFSTFNYSYPSFTFDTLQHFLVLCKVNGTVFRNKFMNKTAIPIQTYIFFYIKQILTQQCLNQTNIKGLHLSNLLKN